MVRNGVGIKWGALLRTCGWAGAGGGVDEAGEVRKQDGPVFSFAAHKPSGMWYTFCASFGRTGQDSLGARTAAGRAGRIGQSIANLVS